MAYERLTSVPPQPNQRLPLAGRRQFLAAAAAAIAGAAAAGCLPLLKEKREPAPPDPDVVVTVRALERTDALLAEYAAAATRHPAFAASLRPFRKRHKAHRAELRARLPKGHPARRRGTPAASASPSPRRSGGKDAALARLVAGERKAATALVTDALDAGSTLAQVLASMSACASAHVRLLGRVQR